MSQSINLLKPNKCHTCGSRHYYKNESRMQVYKDILNGKIVEIQIRRQRYRCAECQTKVWDRVIGACPYRRKTYKLLEHEGVTLKR